MQLFVCECIWTDKRCRRNFVARIFCSSIMVCLVFHFVMIQHSTDGQTIVGGRDPRGLASLKK
jgi:hypothetical protein